ncbi:hypothetical protein C2S52_022868 [Perilla frutescens var. hirtella]|nr:hypothetical protein C2S52_022868 [Perilla frutescens var. hirtella]
MDSSRLIKPIRASPKPLLLKDHLLDDMSSCSSNGFKSFPRRQCCTTVRFNTKPQQQQQQKAYVNFNRPPSKSAISALITAVKRLPFGAAKSSEKKKSNFNSFLPRSFSKRIFKKGGFWKRKPEKKEIERWKSFDQLLKEEPQPSDDRESCGFTVSDGGKSSNLPDGSKNDVAVVKPGEEEVSDGVGVTNDDVSMESTTTTSSDGSSDTNSSSTETKKQWSSDQEKEQFSPVSVLDCPFEDDEDDEVSSPFQHRLARMEGTRKKLLKKIQRFEGLAKLEPVNLTGRFASQSVDSDDESSPHSSTSLNEAEEEEEEEALKLLDQMKGSMPCYGLNLIKAERLLLDFFEEHCTTHEKQHDELVEVAEDWINGAMPRGMFMEWEVEKNRKAYVEDMERGGEWRSLDEQNEEVVLELENEVFLSLLNELLLDIYITT